MTLATRCSACSTTFKVVQDQLKVSGGWVRCGRCHEVFNAIEGLFEFDAEPPAGEPPAARPEAALAAGARMPAAADAPPSESDAAVSGPAAGATTTPVRPDAVAQATAPPQPKAPAPQSGIEALECLGSIPGPEPAPRAGEPKADAAGTPPAAVAATLPPEDEPTPEPRPEAARDVAGDAAVDVAVDATASAAAGAPPADAEAAIEMADPATRPESPTDAQPAVPGFVRKAELAARWRRPGVRAGLAALALLLALVLAAQAVVAWRDLSAARWPAARPWLKVLCTTALDCTIAPPRQIASLTVETSGLQQIGKTTIYRLSLVLRNRAEHELLLPAIDLVLSDAAGAAVARRVVTAAELGSSSRSIAAGTELALQASLNAGDRRVVGYTIELFYP